MIRRLCSTCMPPPGRETWRRCWFGLRSATGCGARWPLPSASVRRGWAGCPWQRRRWRGWQERPSGRCRRRLTGLPPPCGWPSPLASRIWALPRRAPGRRFLPGKRPSRPCGRCARQPARDGAGLHGGLHLDAGAALWAHRAGAAACQRHRPEGIPCHTARAGQPCAGGGGHRTGTPQPCSCTPDRCLPFRPSGHFGQLLRDPSLRPSGQGQADRHPRDAAPHPHPLPTGGEGRRFREGWPPLPRVAQTGGRSVRSLPSPPWGGDGGGGRGAGQHARRPWCAWCPRAEQFLPTAPPAG
jgi:hypothetical protein